MWGSIFSGLTGILSSLFGGGSNGSRDSSQKSSTLADSTTSLTQGVSSTDITGNQTVAGDTTTQNSQTQDQSGTVTRLDAPVQDALTNDIMGMLSAAQGRQDVLGNTLQGLGQQAPFDSQQYVDNVTNAARTGLRGELSSNMQQLAAKAGSSSSGNTAVALTQDAVLRKGEAQLAGINSQAQISAAQLAQNQKNGQVSGLAGLNNSMQSGLTSMLSSLLNAKETSAIQKTGTASTSQLANTTTQNTQTKTGKVRTAVNQTGFKKLNSNASGSKQDGASPWGSLFNTLSNMFSSSF